jgi:hypothetical protein
MEVEGGEVRRGDADDGALFPAPSDPDKITEDQ